MKKKYTKEQIEEIMMNAEKEVSDEIEKISQDTLEEVGKEREIPAEARFAVLLDNLKEKALLSKYIGKVLEKM